MLVENLDVEFQNQDGKVVRVEEVKLMRSFQPLFTQFVAFQLHQAPVEKPILENDSSLE